MDTTASETTMFRLQAQMDHSGGEEIPGTSQSFRFTGIQLIPIQEYTCCITANFVHGQISYSLNANFTELQGGWKCHIVVMIKLVLSSFTQNLILQQISVQLSNANKGMKSKLTDR